MTFRGLLENHLLHLIVAVVLLDVATASYAILEGSFPATVSLGSPIAYRNIYIHVPSAITTYLLFAIAALSAAYFLRKRDMRAYTLSSASVAVGLVYAAITLITGTAWASESWGVAWNWDPKQTAVLFLFIAYMVYFPLSRSISDPERRATIASAYAIAAFSMVIISFAANRIVESLHPTGQAVEQFASEFRTGALFGVRMALALATGLSIVIVLYRVLRGQAVEIPRAIPLVVAGVGVALAMLLFVQLVGGEVYRVVSAEADDIGRILWITVQSGGSEKTFVFDPPVESPIDPPVTIDGRVTIVGHLVKLAGDTITVLPHWSNAVNMLSYSLGIAALLAYAYKRRAMSSDSGNTESPEY